MGGFKDAEAHQQNTTQNQCLQEKMSGQSERREESGKNAYEERLSHTHSFLQFLFLPSLNRINETFKLQQ